MTFALCYRAPPSGYNPDSCLFEVYVLERLPEGEEPETEWVLEPDATEENGVQAILQNLTLATDDEKLQPEHT